jgi:ornithine carbamoyltransferase
VVAKEKEEAKQKGCSVKVTNDPKEAIKSADIVYTDVWASMGKEKEHEERIRVFKPYRIKSKLVKEAKEDYLFMHCLPAHRGEEVSEDVIEGPQSRVWDEAENRLHIQKALMAVLMGGEPVATRKPARGRPGSRTR